MDPGKVLPLNHANINLNKVAIILSNIYKNSNNKLETINIPRGVDLNEKEIEVLKGYILIAGYNYHENFY
jgi:hypothetical protein